MSSTGKVTVKPIIVPLHNGNSQKTKAPESAIDFSAIANELNKEHQTAYQNFKADIAVGKLTVDECTRVGGYKINPFCKDSYILEPEDLTYQGVSNRYGLKKGELGRLGFLKGIGGNAGATRVGFPMTFSKAYLDGVMSEHKAIIGIKE